MPQVTVDGLEEVLQSLERLESGSFVAKELEKAIARFSEINARQYQQNRKLPYSPKYVGKLKPSKQHRAGVSGDPGYAMDTLALYNDAVQNWEVDGSSLQNWSDLHYANYQSELMEEKGSSFYGEDSAYFQVLEATIGDAVMELWADG